MKKILSILFSFSLFALSLSAQDCFFYHEYECKYPNSSYYYSGQSRGALFAYGMTSQFNVVTFGKEEYHISICHQFKLKNVRLRLLEDNESKTVIYDNAEHKYQTEMIFSNNVARKIIIEISVPEDPTGKDKTNVYCLGVLIHFKKLLDEPQNKIGF